MSSYPDQETVAAPPAKRRKTSNSDGVTNSLSQENHSEEQVRNKLGFLFLNICSDLFVRDFWNCLPFLYYVQVSMSDGNMDNQMQIDEGLYSRQL